MNSIDAPTPAAPASHTETKPKWFAPITIGAIVLGSLFGCCGVTAVGGQLMSRAAGPAMFEAQANSAPTEEAAAALRTYMDRHAAFQGQIFPFAMTTGALGLLHSIALIVAGVLAYKQRATGRKLLLAVCVVGLGLELVSGAFGLYVAKQTSGLTADMMRVSMTAHSQGAADTDEGHQMSETAANMAARATSLIGYVMLVGLFVFKSGYYVLTALYLQRKDVADFFEAPAAAS